MRLVQRSLSAAVLVLLAVAGVALGFRLPGLHSTSAEATEVHTPVRIGTIPADSIVATAHAGSLPLYASPTSVRPIQSLSSPAPDGQALVFLVRDNLGSWLKVDVPQRPDGATAWIPLQDVSLATDPYFLTVSTGRHVLTVWKSARAVFTTPVAVGTPTDPTPQGAFYLSELLRQPDPQGAYGPFAFGTSAFSNRLFSFGGGPGQIGLHGTDEPSSIGQSASHGCVRVTNQVIERLVRILPLGTPITIGR